jgi:ABC-2 type transport system permease protein
MNKIVVIVNKEWKQFFVELKVFWLPIVFILLGMTQPVITYYMPVMLKNFSGSKGIIIDPNAVRETSGEVLASTLGGQFDQLGIIILAVSLIGIIQMDRNSGMLGYILSRPISIRKYIFSKYISNLLLVVCTITLGYMVSYFYTTFLFGDINALNVFISLAYYMLWVSFMVAVLLLMSALFESTSVIAMSSIITLIIIRIFAGIDSAIGPLLPSSMAVEATKVLISDDFGTPYVKIAVTLIWTFGILMMAQKVIKRRIQ